MIIIDLSIDPEKTTPEILVVPRHFVSVINAHDVDVFLASVLPR